MKNFRFLRLLPMLCIILIPFTSKALDAGVSFAVYNTPDGTPYLEVNLEIAAGSIMYRHIDSTKM
ncbi:MAG: hypothetical protein JNJ57_12230, partial [Saprospiraceae bacterium]|nr:hypothetical protein [Saprospiraceae bacterium]